jgi:SNF2 family DNA or RNA helicase
VDESTTIKQSKSNRTKNVLEISQHSKYRRILTGSPITQNPGDLYSQFQFLDPQILDFPNDFMFEKRYAVKKELRFGSRTINKIVGWQRQDELYSLISPYSIRILKSDCLDLPPKVYQKRNVELTPEQKKHYNEMKEMALTSLSNEDIITVHGSVLPLISKLQQIVCGFIKDTHKNKIYDIKNNRINAVMDILEEVSTGKVIIWSNFVHNIQKINKAIASKYGQESVASFYGDVSAQERQDIINNFQNPTHPLKYFVGNQQTGGMGITLTEANTVIYFSNNYKYDDRIQSEDRCHRIGQRKTVTYIDLCSEKTVDDRILWILKDKNNISKTVLKEDIQDWIV